MQILEKIVKKISLQKIFCKREQITEIEHWSEAVGWEVEIFVLCGWESVEITEEE